MKGLLVKDMKLLKLNRNFLGILIAVEIILLIFSDGLMFPVGFMTMVVGMFGISTISYDEMDNGNAFLFTMPFSRKAYVLEKYLESFLLDVIALIVTGTASLIAMMIKGGGDISELPVYCIVILFAVLLMQGWMIPITLAFGGEKGRVAGFVMFAGIFAAVVFCLNIFSSDIPWVFKAFAAMGGDAVALAAFVLTAALYALSIAISMRIVAKKEF